jgi:Uma2 family endonuclease
MPLPETSRRLTEAEYLEIERAAEFRSEFYQGEMFAMTGASPQHTLITANVIGEFRHRLKGSQCRVHTPDLRIKIEATGLCTYPDVAIICGPLQFAQGTKDTVVNPTVLVEVLSESTEAYDRGRKFEHYRQIPSLREYLLIRQTEPRVEQFIRQADGRWLLNESSGMDKNLDLPSLAITVPLAEIFAEVDFAPGPIRPPAPQ